MNTDAPEGRGKWALPRPRKAWFVACESRALKKSPLQISLYGEPIVLFRNEGGQARALLDRCAHRNVPLSGGRCVAGQIQCPYHGWQFDGEGECRKIPALIDSSAEHRGRRVPSYATTEQQGYVWLWGTPQERPSEPPFEIPLVDAPGYTTVRYVFDVEGSMFATAENALDVPHTAFLHGGWFRGLPQRPIEVVTQRFADRAQAEFIGEPAPRGLVGRILAPSGGMVTHFDRFIKPSVVQVEYALGKNRESHLMMTDMLTPLSDFKTRMHATVSLKIPWIGPLAALVARPVAIGVLKQDARVLKKQSEWTQRFEGERFVSSEVDVLGKHILRLLRDLERGESTSQTDAQRIRMLT